MVNLIHKIIEIDSRAEERLHFAKEEEEKIISGAYAEEKRLRQEILQSSEEKIRIRDEKENQKTEEKLALLEREAGAEISALEKQSQETSAALKQKIFRSIVGDL